MADDIVWKKAVITNPTFKCRKCPEKDIDYRVKESFCGGYDDIQYKCNSCGHRWWSEGIDS